MSGTSRGCSVAIAIAGPASAGEQSSRVDLGRDAVRFGESSSEANLLYADVGASNGIRSNVRRHWDGSVKRAACVAVASPREAIVSGPLLRALPDVVRASYVVHHVTGLCEVDVVRAPGLLGLTWWTCNRRGGSEARSDTRW